MSARYYEFLDSRKGWTAEQRYDRRQALDKEEARLDELHRQVRGSL